MPLSVRRIESLTKTGSFSPGRFTDGDGLHLHVRPNGASAWVLRFRLHGKQRDMGLGPYPDIGLAEARQLARDARGVIQKGADPTALRRKNKAAALEAASNARSFKAAADAMIDARKDGWKNEKHAAQWGSTLSSHAYPKMGAKAVSEIDTDDVLAVLGPIWTRIPETARRLRGRIETVLDFARARGWRAGENPARWRGHLAELLSAPRKSVSRQPSLDWRELPAFLSALESREGMAALALRFTILTAARTGETRGMTWGEVDLEARIWAIPGSRMKAGNTHRVPLSTPAVQLLQRMRAFVSEAADPRQQIVFPGARLGRPLSDMALSMLARGMALDGLPAGTNPRWRDPEGRAVVPHGFRATFRGWTRAHGWADYLGELALAHVDPNKVRLAYAREDMLEERRPMMDEWGKYCL